MKTQEVVRFTVGNRDDVRTYELVPFLEEGESYVSEDVMVERAKELNANPGEEDGVLILKNKDEIN